LLFSPFHTHVQVASRPIPTSGSENNRPLVTR
jgi:hypothetical protein